MNKPVNCDAPPLSVLHADLVVWSEESDYKSCCPSCKDGLLLVHRDPKTLRLLRRDRCISCGQVVDYLDQQIAGEPLEGELR